MARSVKWIASGILLLNVLHAVTAEKEWSEWYNSDRPVYGQGVDDETLQRISLMYDVPCSGRALVAVQCRQVGSNDTFSHQWFYNDNMLYVPCNASGLVCRNQDQVFHDFAPCADYEVRVLCDTAEGGGQSSEDDDDSNSRRRDYEGLGSNGGFIAMAAGGSVVLPLVCVLVVQLRKSKREERRRQQQAQRAAEEAVNAEEAARMADAPPAYEELFGNPESVSVISVTSGDSGLASSSSDNGDGQGRRGSADSLVSGRSAGPGLGNGRRASSALLSSSSASSFSSSSTSSSSPMLVEPSARSASSHPGGRGLNGSTPLAVHANPANAAATRTPASSSNANVSARRISSASESSSNSLLPSIISDGNITHYDPPPAYDWPGHEQRSGHVTVVLPSGHGGGSQSAGGPVITSQPTSSSSSSSSGRGSQSRFLGMHLSIFDLMAVIYPDPAPTPPPSYDDALKILGVPTQPEILVT